MKIEFVGTNDVCRGPMALAVLRELVDRCEDEELQEALVFDSSGVANYHEGEDPDPRMRKAAGALGYTLSGRARAVDVARLGAADLVVVMDAQVLNTLRRLAEGDERPLAGVRFLREFEDDGPLEAAVPDPYYGTEVAFAQVSEIVERCCKNLFAQIEARAF